MVDEEGEGVRRARRAGVVALERLVEAGAAADALGEVRAARLEAGCAHAGTGAGALLEVEDAGVGIGAGGGNKVCNNG